jgi:endonuclease YncB( thermonuclease family)
MLAPIALGLLLLAHPTDALKPAAACCDDGPVLLAMMAKCTGSASCKACSNCSRCAHCKGGGSCGACSSSRTVEPDPEAVKAQQEAARIKAERNAREARERERQAYYLRNERELKSAVAKEAAAAEARRGRIESERAAAEKRAANQLPLGKLMMSRGNKAGAADHYRRLMEDYPGTDAALKAEAELSKLEPSYRVARVVDGDTIIVVMDGKQRTVRLIGVDTPETVHPQKPVERFGKEASDFLKGLLKGQSVRLAFDPTGDRQDRYGRLLAYAYLPDGTLVNREIIVRGYGFAYTKYPFRHLSEFRVVEAEARTSKVGMWADETATGPTK